MSTEKIYSKIKGTADNLGKHGACYTRADLAYELREFGIKEDSIEISRLIYDAWLHFRKYAPIRNAFLTNDRRQSVVDAYSAAFECDEDPEKALNTVREHLKRSEEALSRARININRRIAPGKSDNSDIISTITGTGAAANVRKSAEKAFDIYTKMVSGYEEAKTDVRASMSDFVFIREKVREVFNTWSLALVDIFGDSVKVIDPRLFDYDSVEWLDVKGMLEAVRLEYDSISSSCAAIIGEITDSFSTTLKSSASLYRSTGNRSSGLVLAGLNMLGHYMDVSSKTTVLRQELVKFTDKIKKDAVTIKTDMSRLFVIYRTLNELYIPKAEAFFKYADKVLAPEFDRLVTSLYSTPELQAAKRSRDAMLEEYKNLQQKIIDEQFNVDVYTASIEANGKLLEANAKSYREAKACKPSKPSALANILTFGSAEKRFSRDLTEWHEAYAYSIKYYEDLKTDLQADKEELEKMTGCLVSDKAMAEKLKARLNGASAEIRKSAKASDEIKLKVASSLRDIVLLLKTAKEIMSSGLDERHIKAVKATDYTSASLTPETENSIRAFSDVLRENITVGADEFGDEYQDDEGNIVRTGFSEADSQTAAAAANELVQKTAGLFEEYIRLQELKRQSEISTAEYERQLSSLRDAFRKDMSSITGRGDILRESLRKIHLAASAEELKEGLKSLSEGKYEISEHDMEEFINGNKDLTI